MSTVTQLSAENLRDALKDEKLIVKEFIKYDSDQRQNLKAVYSDTYNISLEDDLKKACSGNRLEVCLDLLKPTMVYEAQCLYRSFKGIGTKNDLLIELLCPKDAHEIKMLSAEFEKLTGKNLVDAIHGELSGHYRKLMKQLASGSRSTSDIVDTAGANVQAAAIFKAGIGKMGTDEDKFTEILAKSSFKQIQEISRVYGQKNELNLNSAIKYEFSGYMEFALLAILDCAENRTVYFASCLNEAMQGSFTRNDDLVRLLVSKSGSELAKIKEAYEVIYGQSLFSEIRNLYLKEEISEEYGMLFLSLIGEAKDAK